MKTIKIFLASSEELDYDRMAFGNLVRRLDDMYEKRGIRIKLFEWEDYDSAYKDKRKQDEYNEYVKQSDIFLALFHKMLLLPFLACNLWKKRYNILIVSDGVASKKIKRRLWYEKTCFCCVGADDAADDVLFRFRGRCGRSD